MFLDADLSLEKSKVESHQETINSNQLNIQTHVKSYKEDTIQEQYSREEEMQKESILKKDSEAKCNETPAFNKENYFVHKGSFNNLTFNKPKSKELNKLSLNKTESFKSASIKTPPIIEVNKNSSLSISNHDDLNSSSLAISDIKEWEPNKKDFLEKDKFIINKGIKLIAKDQSLNQIHSFELRKSSEVKPQIQEEFKNNSKISSTFDLITKESVKKPDSSSSIKVSLSFTSDSKNKLSNNNNESDKNSSTIQIIKEVPKVISIKEIKLKNIEKNYIITEPGYPYTEESEYSSDEDKFDNKNSKLARPKYFKKSPDWAFNQEFKEKLVANQIRENKLNEIFKIEKIEQLNLAMVFTNYKTTGKANESALWENEESPNDLKTKLFY